MFKFYEKIWKRRMRKKLVFITFNGNDPYVNSADIEKIVNFTYDGTR